MLTEHRNEVHMHADELAEDDLLNSLSETERRIVSLVAYGRTTEEVGERLFMTPRAVEWNLTKILRKLRMRSRPELTAKFARSEPQAEDGREPS
jgi:two-component system, NarL family, response regulator NreC